MRNRETSERGARRELGFTLQGLRVILALVGLSGATVLFFLGGAYLAGLGATLYWGGVALVWGQKLRPVLWGLAVVGLSSFGGYWGSVLILGLALGWMSICEDRGYLQALRCAAVADVVTAWVGDVARHAWDGGEAVGQFVGTNPAERGEVSRSAAARLIQALGGEGVEVTDQLALNILNSQRVLVGLRPYRAGEVEFGEAA